MIPRLYTELTPQQQSELLTWLTVEGIGYDAAKSRLRERFNFSASRDAIFRFFHEKCANEETPVATGASVLVIDILIDAVGVPVRIKIQAPAGANIQVQPS